MSGVPVTSIEYPNGLFIRNRETTEELDEAYFVIDLWFCQIPFSNPMKETYLQLRSRRHVRREEFYAR